MTTTPSTSEHETDLTSSDALTIRSLTDDVIHDLWESTTKGLDQVSIQFGGMPPTQDEVRDLLDRSIGTWAVYDGTRCICTVHCIDHRPIDFVATVRLYPSSSCDDVPWERLVIVAEWLVEELRSKLGVRKLQVRFCANLEDSKLVEALFPAVQLEGALSSFWRDGNRRLRDVIFSYNPEQERMNAFSLEEAFVGPLEAVVEYPWRAWATLQFEEQLAGRRTALRPIRTDDIPALFQIETQPDQIGWVFRGIATTLAGFATHLESNVSIQYAIETHTQQIIGRIFLYDAAEDFRHGRIAMVVDPRYWNSGWPLEALMLFLGNCFAAFPLEVLYFDTYSAVPNGALGAMARTLDLDAHLMGDRLIRGVPYDRFIFSLTRESAKQIELLLFGAHRAMTAKVQSSEDARRTSSAN